MFSALTLTVFVNGVGKFHGNRLSFCFSKYTFVILKTLEHVSCLINAARRTFDRCVQSSEDPLQYAFKELFTPLTSYVCQHTTFRELQKVFERLKHDP